MADNVIENLKKLYAQWSGSEVDKVEELPAHGSYRKYYRLYSGNQSVIAAHNEDKAENIAFLKFSRQFKKAGMPVPEIFADDEKHNIYLEEDLGDDTLFSYLSEVRQKEGFSDNIIAMYEKVVNILPQFQISAGKEIDYSVCYPRHSFDKQSMMWDLNYFKYYFLKLAQIPFDEQKLEDDFQKFSDFLLSVERDFFLYRDFQSRNVMLVDGNPYFIDYQGGRRGALQYDLASLLYDAKADIPPDVRETLLDKYIEAAATLTKIDKGTFLDYYYGYVYIRIMQALGAYGFRGFYERKAHFLKSVPYAIQNLENLLHRVKLPIEIPELTDAWSRLVRSTKLRQLGNVELKLRVRIQSFSYKRGIPWDDRGHGGGFVFDCRALPNPGRFPEYKNVTGADPEVIEFFSDKPDVDNFLNHAFEMVEQAVINYQSRNFTDLMVAFGCTGGQHRSVYCANQLKQRLENKFDVLTEVRHREQEL
jgi:aminoglycoside/choline kinase family phosphotransferase